MLSRKFSPWSVYLVSTGDYAVIFEPCFVIYSICTGGSRSSSPDQEAGRLGTSPHINKFLAREPPDGCEKVNLKFVEDTRYVCGMTLSDYGVKAELSLHKC
jgi:hypothetical protein